MPDDLAGIDFGAYLAEVFEKEIAPDLVCTCSKCGAQDFTSNEGAPYGWLKLVLPNMNLVLYICDHCNRPVPKRSGPYR